MGRAGKHLPACRIQSLCWTARANNSCSVCYRKDRTKEDIEQTPVTLPPTQLIRNLGRLHNNFSKYEAPIPWHCCVQPPARRGDLVFCNVPPGMLQRGTFSQTHPGCHSQVPHTGQRSSSVLTLVMSCAKPARDGPASCSQSSVLIGEASAPAVLSPVTSGLALPSNSS